MYATTCTRCNGTYTIAEAIRSQHQEDGTCWRCPYCSESWGYHARGDNDKLRKRAERADAALVQERARHDQTKADRDHAERRRRAEKAAKTRLRKRIGNGVCPYCNRAFANLADHIRGQHPSFPAGDDQPGSVDVTA